VGQAVSSWAFGGPISSPFALPTGLAGRLAGRIMLWTNRQRDLLKLLDVRPGDHVLEVGYGPGGLLRLLAAHTRAERIYGVDPSSVMLDAASHANRAAVRDGRMRLAVGTADQTGLPDASCDRVVGVNNVGLWPDLDAGLTELHRVTRPGGTVTLAWHGGSRPGAIARRLRLPADKLTHLEARLRAHFTSVTHTALPEEDVFLATRGGGDHQ
jgi:ubiquinone/menaquinone biosynthesis C-methylase UbiE